MRLCATVIEIACEWTLFMLNCGKKKNRNKSDISNVAKMAEAIDDDVNNSNNKSNITAVTAATTVTSATVTVAAAGSGVGVGGGGVVGAAAVVSPAQNANDSGNGDMSFMANNRNANCSITNNNPNSRRSMQRFSCSRCCNDIFNYLMRFRASPEEMEQRHKSREIDRLLEKDKHTFRRQVNVALLCFVWRCFHCLRFLFPFVAPRSCCFA